ncbi:hypothetical protein ACKVWC_000355 [Pyricularia oryzae]
MENAKYTIGWIVAIETEFSASATFFDEEHDNVDTVDNDENAYLFGSIGTHNVVMASLPKGRIGTNPAASAIGDMVRSFPNLRFVIMVGIACGAPTAHNDIRLGDVVVGVPGSGQGGVRHCDFGVSRQNADFKEYGHLNGPPTKVLGAITRLHTKHTRRGHDFEKRITANLDKNPPMKSRFSRPKTDMLYKPDCEHPTGKNISLCSITCPPESILERTERNKDDFIRVHYGIIASGNRKIEDAVYRDKYAEEANILCFEMEAAGIMNRFPCLVIRGICDYADTHINKDWQGFAAMAAAAYAYDFLSSIPPKAIEAEKQLVEVIDKLAQNVERAVPKIENINRDIAFTKLPTAKGATFDDHANEHDPACHPDTRVDLLDDIYRWIENPNGKHIFWLRGMAGTGKSTISRTVAKKISETKMPIASFFFKKGEGDRGKAARFFTTIIDQLVRHHQLPDLASHVHSAVESNPNIADKTMKEQFEKLFLKPLNKCNGANFQPLLVVVDALDECDREEDVTTLIQLDVNSKLRRLHSVLNISDDPIAPVKLLHLSFRDFLVDDENRDGNLFWVDAQKTHKQLAERCLKLLSTSDNLKRDVCNLRRPEISRSEISEQIVSTALPPDVQYACRYWVHHWKESKMRIRDDGVCTATLEGHSNWVNSVAFSADGQKLASASYDNTVKLWDPATGVCTATLEGHSNWVNSVAFSADGHKLASASDDGTVKLWDPATGVCTATLDGHSDSVHSVAFSADGHKLASASADGTVKLWDPATDACTATLKDR